MSRHDLSESKLHISSDRVQKWWCNLWECMALYCISNMTILQWSLCTVTCTFDGKPHIYNFDHEYTWSQAERKRGKREGKQDRTWIRQKGAKRGSKRQTAVWRRDENVLYFQVRCGFCGFCGSDAQSEALLKRLSRSLNVQPLITFSCCSHYLLK